MMLTLVFLFSFLLPKEPNAERQQIARKLAAQRLDRRNPSDSSCAFKLP